MKAKKVIILLMSFIFTIFLGCDSIIRDDEIYLLDTIKEKDSTNIFVSFTTEGVDNFKSANLAEINKNDNRLIISVSKDKTTAIVMERIEIEDELNIIKGHYEEKVNLYKMDLLSGNEFIIAYNIPFVSTLKWNSLGNKVAFCGGGKLTIFDIEKNKTILQPELENQKIIYFGWSPDGKKLYTEHNSLSNDSICYVDSSRIYNSYETKEDLYYKGILDAKYYYGTKLIESFGGMTSKTVITDEMGNIFEDFPQGRYRDSYKKSVLQVGEKKYGLYYYNDISVPNQYKILSNEFIYDVKFISGGNIAYIVKNTDIEKNNYI